MECTLCRDWGKYETHADHTPPKEHHMKKPKTARQILEQRKRDDPEGHNQSLARAYGVGGVPRIMNGDRVRLLDTTYGSVHEGTLLLHNQESAPVNAYGIWTIRHSDGSLFRSEGYLEAL